MRKTIGEKSQYILTPITATSYNRGVKLSNGFSVARNLSKKTIVILLTFIVAFSGLFIANIQSTQTANADLISDAVCNNGFNNGVYKVNGNGSTFMIPDMSLANVLGISGAGALGAQKLTGYEKYGTSGTNYSSWKSATTYSDIAKTGETEFTPWYGGSTVKTGVAPANPGEGQDGKTSVISTNSQYWSNDIAQCSGLSGAIFNGIANYQLSITELGVTFINTIYFVAFFGSQIVFDGMYNIVNGVVEDLRTSLFIPFIELFVILGALWMFWQGVIKRKSTEAFQGALWMAGAAIAGAILLSNPSYIPNAANLVINSVNGAVNDTLTGGAQTAGNANKVLCEVDGGLDITSTEDMAIGKNGDTISTEEKVTKQTITKSARLTQCSIWYNLVYVPWVVGQFGISPTDSDAGDVLNITGSFSSSLVNGIPLTLGEGQTVAADNRDWALLQLNSQSINDDLKGTVDGKTANPQQYSQTVQAAAAYAQLVEQNNGTWAGRDGVNRINVASASMVAMVGTGLIVVLFSFEMIALKLAMLLLMLLMPIFLLIGVHPGIGRRIVMRWLEFLANVTIKQILLGILLSIFLLFYAIIMGSGIWLVQNILIIAVTILGLSYKGKIMNVFAEVDFGGEKRITDPGKDASDGLKRTMSAVVGAAAGAAAAGMAVSTGGASAAAGAAGAGGAGAAGAGAGGSGAASAMTAVKPTAEAPKPEAGKKGDSTVAPSSQQTKEAPKPEAQFVSDKQQELRQQAILKGAIMGAMNGFSSGNIQGAVFGATSTGMMIGDQIGDNHRMMVSQQQQASSSQFQASTTEKMLEELRMMRQEQINNANKPPMSGGTA